MSNTSNPTMIVLYVAEKDPENSGFFRTAYRNVRVTRPIDKISGDRKSVMFHVPDGINEIDRDHVVGIVNPFTNEPTTNYRLRKDNYSPEALQNNWTIFRVEFLDKVTTPEVEEFEDMLEDTEGNPDELTADEAIKEKLERGANALASFDGRPLEGINISESSITFMQRDEYNENHPKNDGFDLPFSAVLEIPRDHETKFVVYLDGVWTSIPNRDMSEAGFIIIREYKLVNFSTLIHLI